MNDLQINYVFFRNRFVIDNFEYKMAFKPCQPAIRDLLSKLNNISYQMDMHPCLLSILVLATSLFSIFTLFNFQFFYFTLFLFFLSICVGVAFHFQFTAFAKLVNALCCSFDVQLMPHYAVKNFVMLSKGLTFTQYKIVLVKTNQKVEIVLDDFGNASHTSVPNLDSQNERLRFNLKQESQVEFLPLEEARSASSGFQKEDDVHSVASQF